MNLSNAAFGSILKLNEIAYTVKCRPVFKIPYYQRPYEWDKETSVSHGNALERLRATQMMELTEKYTSWQEVENLVRMLILEIQLAPSGKVQILFMDGICLENISRNISSAQ